MMNGYTIMVTRKFLTAAGIGAALVLAAACTVHKTETPSLTGPSGLGTNVTITVSPDVLTRDGASQSVVTVTATNANGQPIPNLSLRLAVLNESGQVTDALGTLSAQNVVTNGSGQANAVFTAPAGIPGVTSSTTVEVGATPAGSDFGNETMRVAQIQLTPQGVIGAPPSSLKPDFSPLSATLGDTTVFSATVVDSTGANAINKVTSLNWNFGDGATATGQTATHTFTAPGSFPVTLTITDLQGSTAFVTHSVTVGQGQLPTATFEFSPAGPVVGAPIHFNATGSTAAPGHVITAFAWNFGDGTLGSGPLVDHTYTQSGTYTVTLKVTDDAGRASTLFTKAVDVGSGVPVADFTFSPSAPHVGQTVTFDGSITKPAAGRTIVRYDWTFDDGTTATTTSPTVTHVYGAASTYNVRLVVTDDQGKVSVPAATHPVVVSP
jgi:PKD repeat protein